MSSQFRPNSVGLMAPERATNILETARKQAFTEYQYGDSVCDDDDSHVLDQPTEAPDDWPGWHFPLYGALNGAQEAALTLMIEVALRPLVDENRALRYWCSDLASRIEDLELHCFSEAAE